MILHVDASLDEVSEVLGIGYHLRTKNGAEITGKRYIEGDYTSMQAEAFALLKGLGVASCNRNDYDNDITVVSDCHPLVEKIHEPDNMYDNFWYGVRKAALQTMMEFDEWQLVWRERTEDQGTVEANRLAREALWHGRGDDGVETDPSLEGIRFIGVECYDEFV